MMTKKTCLIKDVVACDDGCRWWWCSDRLL